MKQTIKIDSKQALMIAHRGLSGLEKENTNLAFVAAGNRSYWGIESDVRKTADGIFVMIHDKDTERVAGVNYKVKETDFKTLREVRFKDVDESEGRVDLRIPTLEEYLHICKDYGKIAVLEWKSLFYFVLTHILFFDSVILNFLFYLFIFIEVQLIYNVVLVM